MCLRFLLRPRRLCGRVVVISTRLGARLRVSADNPACDLRCEWRASIQQFHYLEWISDIPDKPHQVGNAQAHQKKDSRAGHVRRLLRRVPGYLDPPALVFTRGTEWPLFHFVGKIPASGVAPADWGDLPRQRCATGRVEAVGDNTSIMYDTLYTPYAVFAKAVGEVRDSVHHYAVESTGLTNFGRNSIRMPGSLSLGMAQCHTRPKNSTTSPGSLSIRSWPSKRSSAASG